MRRWIKEDYNEFETRIIGIRWLTREDTTPPLVIYLNESVNPNQGLAWEAEFSAPYSTTGADDTVGTRRKRIASCLMYPHLRRERLGRLSLLEHSQFRTRIFHRTACTKFV